MAYHDVAERTFDVFEGLEFGLVPGSSPGGAMRRVRNAKGITLDEASRDTRIAARHLESLETENYRHFHARVYAVGFARTYARYLGLGDRDIIAAVSARYDAAGGTPRRFYHVSGDVRRDRFVLKATAVALLALLAIAMGLLALRLP